MLETVWVQVPSLAPNKDSVSISGHGGTGRRVRLRGVWLYHSGSSPDDRTKCRGRKVFWRFYHFYFTSPANSLFTLLRLRTFAASGSAYINLGSLTIFNKKNEVKHFLLFSGKHSENIDRAFEFNLLP